MVDDVSKKRQTNTWLKKIDPAYHRVNYLAFTRLIRDKWLDPLEK